MSVERGKRTASPEDVFNLVAWLHKRYPQVVDALMNTGKCQYKTGFLAKDGG